MSKAPFIDKDAEFLWELGQSLIDQDDADLMQGLRLSRIAERLERMNRADMERMDKGDFAAGALDAMQRIYDRSNLPPEERTMPVAMMKAGLKPRVIKEGVTAKSLAKAEAKAEAEKKVLAKLGGIKLDLSRLTGVK